MGSGLKHFQPPHRSQACQWTKPDRQKRKRKEANKKGKLPSSSSVFFSISLRNYPTFSTFF
jgi:hypothetical protein